MINLQIPDVRELFLGFLNLLYPNLCAGCDGDLPSNYDCFCIRCRKQLQVSDMYLSSENEFTNRFWGRIPLNSGAAMYYFSRKSPIQRALHRLKYKNQPDIGVRMGKRFGELLAQSPVFQNIDGIVPVPLHPKKEQLRGYNQSAMIAQGMSETMQIPVLRNILTRNTASSSQTQKNRMERFENVQEVFKVKNAHRIAGKHLLIVDDVLTTGATLESCGHALLQVPDVKLSMATLAIAMH